jgi:hypothetical protein
VQARQVEIFERVADGLHIPGAMFDLAARPWEGDSVTNTAGSGPAATDTGAVGSGDEEADTERRVVLQGLAAAGAVHANGVLSALDQVRRAVLGHQVSGQPESTGISISNTSPVEAGIARVHRLYQLADYDAAAQLLPLVLNRAEAVVPSGGVTSPSIKTAAYLAGAKLATKLGDAGLAWVMADRCLRFAIEAERPSLVGIASYQVACALLAAGHISDAEQTAGAAAEHVARVGTHTRVRRDDALSVHGALLLLLAIIAARRGDGKLSQTHLHQAGQLAEHLGRDDNRLWTAFGSTNVAIHELSVQVALGTAAALRDLILVWAPGRAVHIR